MFRNGDNSARKIINTTLIKNEYARKDIVNDLKSYLVGEKVSRPLGLENFEIPIESEGTIQNIINKYYLTLEDPEYMALMKFDEYQANELAERIKSIAMHIYGDIELYYLIQYLNNISHPSELSKNFLMNNGLLILTGRGLEKLRDIINFIKSKSSSSDIGEEVLGI